MTNKSAALELRAKILGTILQDARKTKDVTVEVCAQAMGVAPDEYQAYEAGIQAPSLPELEGLAYFLEIPVEHFWSDHTLDNPDKPLPDMERLKQVRQRIIGVMLRQARLDAGFPIELISLQTGLEAEKLKQIETGQVPVPIPELEAICEALNQSLKDYIDKQGSIGQWNIHKQALTQFMEMPEELQIFVSKPVNRPYLDLAKRLSYMSVEKLRSVAEILLEITY